jgi:hypothetical protein
MALFAATFPERTSALALFGTFARRTRSLDYPWHPTREELIRNADRIVEAWGSRGRHRAATRSPLLPSPAEDSVERDRHSISAEQELELRDVPAAAAASELAPAELLAAPATERGARPGPGDPVRHEVVPTLEALRRCARHRSGDPVEAVVELPLELE